jgi:hypothetical protein
MNGVLVHTEQLIPGADQFIAWLKATGRGRWAMRRTIARHTCRTADRRYMRVPSSARYVEAGGGRS